MHDPTPSRTSRALARVFQQDALLAGQPPPPPPMRTGLARSTLQDAPKGTGQPRPSPPAPPVAAAPQQRPGPPAPPRGSGPTSGHAEPPTQRNVAIIGSGNWGTAIASVVGDNVRRYDVDFSPVVPMYVFEEEFHGRPLTELINEHHENIKYLPGTKLSPGVVATPDVVEAARDADLLIFVLPHQFTRSICSKLRGNLKAGARAISLIKGLDVSENGDASIRVFPQLIEEMLGIPCCALSGANIANEVAAGKFSETTIGCRPGELDTTGRLFQMLFHCAHFRTQLIDDVIGVSLGGALKNVVAIAAGFIDGLEWGSNSKAAVMRIGLLEMKRFAHEFFPGVRAETFLESSAGVADLITTCYGGRNRLCAEAFVRTGKPFDALEKELLNGQKLQGVQTAREVHHFLRLKHRVDAFPLFTEIYEIAYNGRPAWLLTENL